MPPLTGGEIIFTLKINMVRQIEIDERRDTIRARHLLSIYYKLYKSSQKKADRSWYLSTTEDMSAGGLSFYSEHEYKTGDILEIHVVMSGVVEIFRGYAKIIRVKSKKTGAYFFTAVELSKNVPLSRSAKTYKKRGK